MLQGVLVSVVDRMSNLTLVGKLTRKTADQTRDVANGLLKPLKDLVHTLTIDNGKEFAYHQEIAKALEADVYFAHPYCSWVRGLNENTNGLVRLYFPKDRDFTTITDEEIAEAMHRLNHRPLGGVRKHAVGVSGIDRRVKLKCHWKRGTPYF